MNFNSPEYLLFLPLVALLHAAVFGGQRARQILLLIASLSLNLGLLALFKYLNFFMDTAGDGLVLFGLDLSLPHHRLLLPVGISFYSFQTLSYTIDVWRRELPVERDLLRFAPFVSFFPQFVAGPIVRAADFLPQLAAPIKIEDERVRRGLFRIFRGLFKKIILADLLANLGVAAVFSNPSAYSSLELVLALYGYAYQIYNDFSGYSDIAIGSAACGTARHSTSSCGAPTTASCSSSAAASAGAPPQRARRQHSRSGGSARSAST